MTWIKTTERRPSEDGDVLCWDRTEGVYVLGYEHVFSRFFHEAVGIFPDPEYWMPLTDIEDPLP